MKKIFFLSCLFLNVYFLKAQQATLPAGGDASGSSGSISYSIGEIDYNTTQGSGGILTEGVQQPFEIMIITGISETTIDLNCSVYPNPSSEFVILTTENKSSRTLYYCLLNEQGKLLNKEQIQNSSTNIQLDALATGVYFIQVTDSNNNEVKSFKVLKNK